MRVLVIGTGNLAWHLVPNLERIGLEVAVWTRDIDRFDYQSSKVGFRDGRDSYAAVFTRKNLSGFAKTADGSLSFDAVFLAVPDDYIGSVSDRLSQLLAATTPIIHTSGATTTTKINDYFTIRAALWPIRSLRRGEVVAEWKDLPLVYFCDDAIFEDQLAVWAGKMSELTYRLDNEQRAQLHLAAVFSNNFTTWLCQIAYELCEEKNVPFEALVPIIKNTFSRIDATEPALRQTGAAQRGDEATMKRHLDLLEQQPAYADLYRRLSAMIREGMRTK